MNGGAVSVKGVLLAYESRVCSARSGAVRCGVRVIKESKGQGTYWGFVLGLEIIRLN